MRLQVAALECTSPIIILQKARLAFPRAFNMTWCLLWFAVTSGNLF